MDNKPKHRKPKSTSKSPSHIKKPSKTIHKPSPHHITNLRNSTPHTSSSPTPPAFALDITEKLTNSTIYCRDNERKHITDFMSNDKIKTIFISGQPGTGKTSLLLDIFSTYTCNPKPKSKSLKHYIKVTMNCMSMTTTTDFYSNIFISLKYLIS
jgi:Cdc6-like AAA superfamily ATPase